MEGMFAKYIIYDELTSTIYKKISQVSLEHNPRGQQTEVINRQFPEGKRGMARFNISMQETPRGHQPEH